MSLLYCPLCWLPPASPGCTRHQVPWHSSAREGSSPVQQVLSHVNSRNIPGPHDNMCLRKPRAERPGQWHDAGSSSAWSCVTLANTSSPSYAWCAAVCMPASTAAGGTSTALKPAQYTPQCVIRCPVAAGGTQLNTWEWAVHPRLGRRQVLPHGSNNICIRLAPKTQLCLQSHGLDTSPLVPALQHPALLLSGPATAMQQQWAFCHCQDTGSALPSSIAHLLMDREHTKGRS